jgi:hypothetical protein
MSCVCTRCIISIVLFLRIEINRVQTQAANTSQPHHIADPTRRVETLEPGLASNFNVHVAVDR